MFSLKQRLAKFSQVKISINGEIGERVNTFKYLGVLLDETLNLERHIQYISGKIRKKLGLFSRCRKLITQTTALTLYKSLLLPHFDYCDQVWDTCSQLEHTNNIYKNDKTGHYV